MSLEEHLRSETDKLRQSWMQYDAEMLRDYLVAGVEDPRINVQSILTRHFLLVILFGTRFEELMEDELRFALVMNWIAQVLPEEDLQAFRHALARGADHAEGISIPSFVTQTSRRLTVARAETEVPNYIADVLEDAQADTATPLSTSALGTFERLWQRRLAPEPAPGLSVLEAACGSANDYRFFETFGLARLIQYTGFDLCPKNVANALKLFPAARFALGNVLSIDAADHAYDCAIVHDLFEHLSPEACAVGLRELGRVTRSGLCLGFFNMWEGEDHIVQPVDDYHWNKLSLPRVRAQLEEAGFQVHALHIGTFLKWRFGCSETHNPNAYTLLASR